MREHATTAERQGANLAPGAVLQRQCACGRPIAANGECAECRKKRMENKHSGTLQRRAVADRAPEAAPPIVHNVLRSPGRSLDPGTRSHMESSFGHDFSQVRVHTDAQAAESARAMNAQAYTVRNHVVFAGGQRPEAVQNRRVLAHELAHVVQQHGTSGGLQALRVGAAQTPQEQQAEHAAARVASGHSAGVTAGTGGAQVQRRLNDGHDLTATRFAGNRVLEAVYDNERLLKNGSSGTAVNAAVKLVQESLVAQGYTLPIFGADGKFGDETETAVRQFQIDAGAQGLDGIIGPETMQLLDMRDPGGTTPTGPRATPPPAVGPAPPPATGVVFAEHPDETFAGYDASTAPDWLVVPENERRQAQATITPAAARPAIVSADPTVATVDPTPDGIVVTGVAHGTTEIRAQEGGATLSRLRIAVKRQLRRSVFFNYVCDSAAPAHCSNGAPPAEEMRSLLNRVWERQANVLFTDGTSRNIVAPGDLGPYVNDDGFGGDEMATVVAAAPATADYNVFRVWEVRVKHGAVNNALNNTNNTLVGNAPCADGWGLPHEAGHFLGLGHGSGFIMTPCGGRADQRVSKAMADLVNA